MFILAFVNVKTCPAIRKHWEKNQDQPDFDIFQKRKLQPTKFVQLNPHLQMKHLLLFQNQHQEVPDHWLPNPGVVWADHYIAMRKCSDIWNFEPSAKFAPPRPAKPEQTESEQKHEVRNSARQLPGPGSGSPKPNKSSTPASRPPVDQLS